MDWENLRHLYAFAEHGSLAAAARALGVEHATVARRIAALETQLQTRLVDRRGRRLLLTGDGERIAAIARRMREDADAVERAAAGARSELTGTVTISAPPALAAARLIGPLVALQQKYRRLELRLIGESRSAALERREADIAIRLSRPRSGELIIVRLGAMPFRLYASPGYLRDRDERDWSFVGYDAPMAQSPQQRRLRAIAAGRAIAFTASSAELQQAAARAGAGVAMLPGFMADNDPALVRVDGDAPPFQREIWLAIHADMKTAAGVRAVVDALKAAFTTGAD